MNYISIAIDGPSGAGKSTIAKKLAKSLGFVYVDTGALYRAIGYATIQKGIDYSCTQDVIDILPTISVDIMYENGIQKVLLNSVDVSAYIRTPEVSMAASAVSAIPEVRKFLFDTQQNIAKSNNVIMDGRDIGTVVLPNAQIKIFLTASAEDRAQRRYDELIEKGMDVQYDSILADMKQRDYNDSHRSVAPLKPADDAILIDTSGNSLEESVQLLLKTVEEKLSCQK